jgi:hypothetical protein
LLCAIDLNFSVDFFCGADDLLRPQDGQRHPALKKGATTFAKAGGKVAAPPGFDGKKDGWTDVRSGKQKDGKDTRFPMPARAEMTALKRQQLAEAEEWEPTGDPEEDKKAWEEAKKAGKFKSLTEMPVSSDDFFSGSRGGSR